jgi:hypothetical protein
MTNRNETMFEPWLPRHCVISPNEEVPYAIRFMPVTNKKQFCYMCANQANRAISEMIGRWKKA